MLLKIAAMKKSTFIVVSHLIKIIKENTKELYLMKKYQSSMLVIPDNTLETTMKKSISTYILFHAVVLCMITLFSLLCKPLFKKLKITKTFKKD